MTLVETTRRRFGFKVDRDFNFELDDVKGEGGAVWFLRDHPDNKDKRTFDSPEECLAWWQGNKAGIMTMDFDPDKKQSKTLSVQFGKSAIVSDDEWAKIQKLMVVPEHFSKDDVRVYHPKLAHNFIDRDRERFTKAVLDVFNKTIIDKPVLIGHQWGPPGEGRFFDSGLERVSIDEAMAFVGTAPFKGFKKHLEEIQDKDGGLYILTPSFYLLKDEEAFIRKLDAGIIKDMSIGFRATAKDPVKDKDGNVIYNEYTAVLEAMEGSFVWVGSQYGAQNRKGTEDKEPGEPMVFEDVMKPYPNEHACRLNDPDKYVSFRRGTREHEGKKYSIIFGKKEDGKTEEQAYRYNKAVWNASEAKAHCDTHKGAFEPAAEKDPAAQDDGQGNSLDGGINMKFELKSLEIEKDLELTEESMKGLQDEIDEKVSVLVAEVEDCYRDTGEQLTAIKAVLGEDLTAESARKLLSRAEAGDKFINALVDEANKFKVLLGLVVNDAEKVAADKEFLKSLTLDQLTAQRDQFRNKYDEDHSKGLLPVNSDNKSQDKKQEKEIQVTPKNRFQEIA